MNLRKRSILFARLAGVAVLCLGTPLAMAQHGHDDDGHSHGEMKAAADYASAVREIDERMTTLDGLIAKGDLDEAHEQSDAIGALARSLGALALKPESGVARDKIKDINKAGKALAAASDGVHEAGETNDLAAAKAAYAQMRAHADVLAAFAPARYFCPMHCEGSKTYDSPGSCPVCGMHLKKVTSDKFTVDITPLGATGGRIEAGKPVDLLFTLRDPTGLKVRTVEVVHEQPLHLLMVSRDLSWYAHEHPVLQPDGTFTFTFTFPAGGEYTLFNDFTPKDVGMQVVPVVLRVEGTAPAAKALTVDAGSPKTVDGYTVTLDTGGPVKTGGATHLAYTITKGGKPVTDLQPYLGAMGHLVIISEDQKEFVHSHPHEEGSDHHASTKGGPRVDFEAHFKAPGLYKGWTQFQHNGKIITVPFTFSVAAGAGDADHDHGHDQGHGH